MGSVMSLSCSKRKATSQDVESSSNESVKRRKICSMNDDENCSLIPILPDVLSWKHPWTFCANTVFNVAAAVGFFTRLPNVSFQQDNKDAMSSSLSLPSTSTLVSRIWKHPVFPSFHGADVRKTFLSHILESFRRKGIDPFIDDHIPRTKSIGPELIEAIRGSKIAIVLLSKKYASSSWCLDELVEIMKCRKELSQIVMTIFYEVDPSEIKKQIGDFGNSFRKTCKGKTKEHIERWRKALEDVATIAGEHSRNWSNEAAMIEKIATDVSNMLNISTPSRDFDGLVGMRAHMEMMEQFLRLDLDEVRMIGIWGPPGIGKTTIARVLFNQVSNRFQLSALMVDIKGCYPRPCLDEYNAQLQLQKQMLSQIINQKDIMVSHLGVAQERLKDKKVFLVLDDVDRPGQLNALAKEIQWFGPRSRIIITTEDRRVLKAHKIDHIYKVKLPSSDEAFQIFCMHAFGQMHPDDGFSELAKEVTYLAGELPLGLKVLGSALRGMSKQEWEVTLPRLKTHLDGEIESIIKFSYKALCDKEDRYLFLYIACLFNYQKIHKVEMVLANKVSNVRQRLHVLAERSLISIDNEFIRMHTLLEKFGRETSRKQFIYHGLRKRYLLVDARDIREVLSDDTIDNSRFLGININISEIAEELNISGKALERMSDLQFISIDIIHLAYPLRLHSVLQGLIYHSQKIRSLRWHNFQNICLPSTFNPEFLVTLDMQSSNLQKLWDGTKQLQNLRWMDLSCSTDLKELPDLSTATNLEELRLHGCSSLVELPSSIGKLTSLKILNLSLCSNLVELPSIGNAIKLEQLNLDSCSSLVKLPSSINATNLQKLFLDYCSRVVELPAIENATNLMELNLNDCSSLLELSPSIGTATNLTILKVKGCSSLVKLPDSIGDMTNLEEIDLSNCSSLVELPSSIGNLQKLRDLVMCGCSKLEALPTNINLKSLGRLDLKYCSRLKSFPEISTNIHYLNLTGTAIKEVPLWIISWSRLSEFHISYFESLRKFPHAFDIITGLLLVNEDIEEVLPWVKGMSRLRVLKFNNCNNLVSLPQLSDSLSHIDANNCKSLERLDCSFNNPKIRLKILNLSYCSNLVELPSIGNAIKLEKLDLSWCSSLVKLPSSINATNLRTLFLISCSRVVELPTIENATNLLKLNLNDCSSLLELPLSIGTATNLKALKVQGCSSLVKLPDSIGDMTNLEEIDLSNCSSLVELPSSIGNLQKLMDLVMCGCSKLEALPTNINLKSLGRLDLKNCSRLKSFPEISTNIHYLNLTGTAIKEVLLSIMSWSRLFDFHMSYFESLKEFPHAFDIITELLLVSEDIDEVPPWVKGMSRLRVLRLKNCNNLVSLPQLSDSLYHIDADNCKSLERLDCSFNNPNIHLSFPKCFNLNQEARDLIMDTSTSDYAILPGTQVPACFNHRATAGGSLKIKLNESPLPKSLRFRACIMLVKGKEERCYDQFPMRVEIIIRNEKNDIVPNSPTTHIIDQLLIEHIYTFEVKAAMVTSTELVFEFKTYNRKWKVGECGLFQILELP